MMKSYNTNTNIKIFILNNILTIEYLQNLFIIYKYNMFMNFKDYLWEVYFFIF